MNPTRRQFVQATAAWAAGAAAAPAAHAQQRRSLADPLRLGVDPALVDSGLARALQQGFGRDTGIAVQLVPRPALPLLEALERGELDAALCNAPAAEAALERQGLAHDRRLVARGEFVLVGPAPRGKGKDKDKDKATGTGAGLGSDGDPAGIAGLGSAAQALAQIRSAALAAPGAITFVSAADGSGAHVREQALWREAKTAPAGPWYTAADAASSVLAQARTRGAYALVERGAWAAHGGAPLAVLVAGDPLLAEAVHAMRSFRVSHPAGKIFVAWIAGPKGRRAVAAQRAYRVPEGSP